MPTRIDHVIIAAPDLDQLEATFTCLGFHVTGGGTHPHLGTRNRIIVLGEGYIELLGVADETHISATLRARLASGGGWISYALQSGDIAAEVEAMRARGVDVRGPVPGRLVAPEGGQRSWRVVTIGSDDLWAAAFPLPFLIQHDSVGLRHQQELAGAGGLSSHDNGATRLLGVTLHAADATALRARYERAYGLRARTPSAAFPLGDSGEWINVVTRIAMPGETPTPAATDSIDSMRVTLAVDYLAPVERAAKELGFTTSATATARDVLTVSLPASGAALDFRAIDTQ